MGLLDIDIALQMRSPHDEQKCYPLNPIEMLVPWPQSVLNIKHFQMEQQLRRVYIFIESIFKNIQAMSHNDSKFMK